ncbi:eukaryotic translation initiation factor 2 subunit 2-like [Artemia franciscana]|uniref:eukaryotic translation initiation factor 2 subunit 2-like n=1 Tax=Artemia franciscana TaxID=6661 RepID=UPI0032D9F715
MSEDSAFDIDLQNLKKKKKKKKVPFDFDGISETSQADNEEESKEKAEKTVTFTIEDKDPKDITDTLEDLDLESFGKKKKKSKKKITIQDLEADEKEDDAKAGPPEEAIEDVPETADMDLDLDFSKMKKKAKKSKKDLKAVLEDIEGSEQAGVETIIPTEEKEYTYDDLLERFYKTLKEKNPEMVTGEKKKVMMKPPQVVRVGAKKTSFVNFSDICKLLHRSQKHVLDFLLAELGTQGSIDGTNQLIIKGKFTQKQVENVLRRYVKEYVSCKTCRSLNTTLQKDSRLHFLQCEACNSRCSVVSIKAGFQAVTSKRAAARAKES